HCLPTHSLHDALPIWLKPGAKRAQSLLTEAVQAAMAAALRAVGERHRRSDTLLGFRIRRLQPPQGASCFFSPRLQPGAFSGALRSEEHTSELQSPDHL